MIYKRIIVYGGWWWWWWWWLVVSAASAAAAIFHPSQFTCKHNKRGKNEANALNSLVSAWNLSNTFIRSRTCTRYYHWQTHSHSYGGEMERDPPFTQSVSSHPNEIFSHVADSYHRNQCQMQSTSTTNNVHTPKYTHYKLHTCPYQFQFSRLDHQCVRMYICTHLPGRKTQMMNVFLIFFFVLSFFLLSFSLLCNSFSEYICVYFFLLIPISTCPSWLFLFVDALYGAISDLHIIFSYGFHISWFIFMRRSLVKLKEILMTMHDINRKEAPFPFVGYSIWKLNECKSNRILF